MIPLFDLLNQAHGGRAVDILARQFELSRQQVQLALEALLPAFSQGLKRNASDPFGIAAFMGAVAAGQQAKYFEDVGRAFTPEGMAEGNSILGHLFGSKDVSRAVAAQAAQMTGIAQDTLKRMLPIVADMIMGGFAKQARGEGAAGASTPNPFAGMFEQMMRQSGLTPAAAQQQQAAHSDPFDNPFTRMFREMAGRSERRDQPAGNPFMQFYEQMLGTGRQDAEPERPTNPSGRARNTYDDLFDQMFETGRKSREDYEQAMAALFDQMGPRRGS